MKISNESFYKLKTLVPLFRGFTEEELIKILRLANSKVYNNGDFIFKEKEAGENLFIIVRGTVKITKKISPEYEEILTQLKSGNYFGEMSIIDNMPRSATAEAVEDNTMLLEINSSVLSYNVSLAFKIYKNFCNVLSQRLRDTNEKLIAINSEKIELHSRLKTFIKNKFQKDSDLTHSNYKGVDLKGAFFEKINMADSVFVGASFNEAKFKASALDNANFSGSDISACVFEGCNFNGADFTNATFLKTVFKQCKINDKSFDKTLDDSTTATPPITHHEQGE